MVIYLFPFLLMYFFCTLRKKGNFVSDSFYAVFFLCTNLYTSSKSLFVFTLDIRVFSSVLLCTLRKKGNFVSDSFYVVLFCVLFCTRRRNPSSYLRAFSEFWGGIFTLSKNNGILNSRSEL